MREALLDCLHQIDHQIAAVEQHYDGGATLFQPDDVAVYAVLDANGRPVLADLLCARANLLVALSQIPDHRDSETLGPG